jgi:hypothetical protein
VFDFDERQRFAMCPGFELDEIDGTFLVVDMRRQQVLTLNDSAALVVRLCNGERTFAELVAMLGDAYPDARAEIVVEARATIEALVSHGAIEPRGDKTSA